MAVLADEMFTPTEPRRGVALVWVLALAAVMVVVFLFDPAQSHLFPPCPWRSLTGWSCPGCGCARALHQLLHGRLLAALALNPLLAVYAPLLGYALLSTLSLALRGRPLRRPLVTATWIWVLLAVIVVFWIVRNLPWWPLAV